jgi:hypothetical protein
MSAADFNVAIRFTVDGRTFALSDVQTELASVEREIASIQQQITNQQAEADRYSGGLVQAMSLATVATTRHSLAMLESAAASWE